MSEKGNRNQEQQSGNAQKAYHGYLPSVEGKHREDEEPEKNPKKELRVPS